MCGIGCGVQPFFKKAFYSSFVSLPLLQLAQASSVVLAMPTCMVCETGCGVQLFFKQAFHSSSVSLPLFRLARASSVVCRRDGWLSGFSDCSTGFSFPPSSKSIPPWPLLSGRQRSDAVSSGLSFLFLNCHLSWVRKGAQVIHGFNCSCWEALSVYWFRELWNKGKLGWDFLGGPVVKTPHFQCRGCGFDPWLEN